MHYISGTRFSIVASRALSMRERGSLGANKGLPVNTSFVLLHIKKTEKSVTYSFVGSDNKHYAVDFNSCREADLFIAKYKNEKIPDYNQIIEPADDPAEVE